MAISLTASAADRVRNHIATRGHGLGLRLGVRKTGCSGFAYVVNFADELDKAIDKALGDKKGIERYGFASVPMDEALARVSIDLSGRPALVFATDFDSAGGKIGTFDVQLVREFFQALSTNGKFNCHVEVPHGSNLHHIVEAIFKALGRALRDAVRVTGTEVPSTKGSL